MGAIQNLTAMISLKDNTGAGTRSVVSNLNRIASALDVTHLAATKTFKIDNDIRRMGVQMGLAGEQISRLSMSVVSLSNMTGVSTEKVTELSSAYMATGRTLSVTNAASAKHARVLTELVGRFGLTAAEVVKTDVTLHHFGDSIEGLTDRVAHWQGEFNMPGMLAQMPKAVRFAEQMLTRFGKTTVGNVNTIISATLRLGATYAKTFGTDMAQGMSMAQQTQEHFLTQMQQGRDVFLGLEEDFGGLHKAFFETGRGLDEVNRLMQLGQDDPAAYAREVLAIRENFIALGQGLFAERFFQNVIRNSDEATRSLLTNRGALEDLEEANRRSGTTEGFDKLVESMHSIGSEVVNTVSNLMFLGKTIIGLTFMDVVTDSFKGITDILKNFNEYLVKTAETIKNNEIFQQLRPMLVGIGKVLIGVGAAAGMMASTFASLIIPFRTFVNIYEKLPGLGKSITPVRLLVETIGDLLSGGLNLAGTLGAMGAALNEFGASLKDPNLSLSEVVLSGIRAMSVGMVETFDAVLGGLPTKIAQVFFPRLEVTLGEGVRGIFRDLQLALRGSSGSLVGGWWKSIKEEVQKQFDGFVIYLRTNFDGMQANAATWGENIGRAIGTMADWARDLIAPLFSADKWSEWIHGVVDYLSGPGNAEVSGGFEEIFRTVLSHARTFSVNFLDEALRPFGSGFLEVKHTILDFFDVFRDNFDWLKTVGWPQMQMGVLQFKIDFVETFYNIKDTVAYVFDSIGGYIKLVAGEIGSFLLGIKKEWQDLQVWRAEAALTRSMANPLSDQAERDRRTNDVLRVRGERDATADRIKTLDALSASGRSDVSEADAKDKERRAKSATESAALIDRSKADLADLDLHSKDWEREYTTRSQERTASGNARRAQARTQIMARNATRSQSEVQGHINSLLMRYESKPVIAQTDNILQALRDRLESEVRPTGNSELITGFEQYISRFERIRGSLAEAQTPERVHEIWNELKGYLGATEGGRATAAGLGVRLDESVYSRPNPVGTNVRDGRGAEQSEMLAALRALVERQAQVMGLNAQAQAHAAMGDTNAAQALESAARQLAESARQLLAALQGTATATGPH